jgi:hypothetical protein
MNPHTATLKNVERRGMVRTIECPLGLMARPRAQWYKGMGSGSWLVFYEVEC